MLEDGLGFTKSDRDMLIEMTTTLKIYTRRIDEHIKEFNSYKTEHSAECVKNTEKCNLRRETCDTRFDSVEKGCIHRVNLESEKHVKNKFFFWINGIYILILGYYFVELLTLHKQTQFLMDSLKVLVK